MKDNVLIVNAKDNVGVAIEDLHKGDSIVLPGGDRFEALSDIPYGHKLALTHLAAGSPVIKYGEAVGVLKCDIKRGEWVHLHNVLILEEE